MLVLSRNENERIRIGDNIWLTVVKIQGNRVRLGLQADPDVLIVREELLHRTAGAAAGPSVNASTAADI